MTTALDGAVELLERSLVYTRVALRDVDDSPHGNLDAPTPCPRWDLGRLLAHMEDALDAFTEAASGAVVVRPVQASRSRVDALQQKACALLAAWATAGSSELSERSERSVQSERVEVGAATMAAPLLVVTAALEITVHGWDVTRATGRAAAIPEDLAAALLGPAHGLVGPADRVSRFAPTLATPGPTTYAERLLAHLGRVPDAPAGATRFWEPEGLRMARVSTPGPSS